MFNHSTMKCQSAKMNIYFFVFLLIGFAKSEISERRCIEARYQNKRVGSNENENFCEKMFQNFTTEFKSDVMARLTSEDNQTCILQTFDSYNITALYLKGLTRHLYLNRPDIDAYEDDVDESISALLKAVKVLCTADKKYGIDFDRHFYDSSKNKSMGASHSELCTKKYLFDKKIIDPVAYSINPTSINVTGCGETYNELEETFKIPDDGDANKNTFFGLSAVNAQRCTKEKFAEEKVLHKIYSLQVIQTFILSPQQIDELRSKYIKLMTMTVQFLLDCIKEI